MTEDIFSYHARIHIRSELSGSAMVINLNAHASTKGELQERILETATKYMKQIKDYKEKDYQEIVKEKKEGKWSNKRIRNHFARFGITIDLPDEVKEKKGKKKSMLPGGQKTLC